MRPEEGLAVAILLTKSFVEDLCNVFLPELESRALTAAATAGHLEVVKMLCTHGADLEARCCNHRSCSCVPDGARQCSFERLRAVSCTPSHQRGSSRFYVLCAGCGLASATVGVGAVSIQGGSVRDCASSSGWRGAPLPLYIGQWTLKDECPPYVFFTLFGCWGGGSQGV